MNDVVIVRLLNEHNPHGMELLFGRYYRSLVLWADTFLDNIPLSEDLVQDLFVSLWKKSATGNLSIENLKSYLFTSVKNLALNRLDKRDPLKNAHPVCEVFAQLIEPESIDEELLQALEAEIEKLPPRTKEVVKAVYIDGLKYKEAAQKLNISLATVKTLLVHALKRFRVAFGQNIKEF